MEKLYVIMHGKGRFNGDQEGLFAYLRNTDKQIKYTHGLEFRGPATHKVPVTAEKAIDYFKRYCGDVTEFDDYIHVNTYSGCDFD